jgi:membrane complex biogenesis BtpA family protein
MLYRKQLGLERKVRIFADVMVKHAVPLGQSSDIGLQAADTVKRAMADAIIVSGRATGDAPLISDLEKVRAAVPETPILIGSGSSKENISQFFQIADGIIVASSIKRQGILENPVDAGKIRAFVEAARNCVKT